MADRDRTPQADADVIRHEDLFQPHWVTYRTFAEAEGTTPDELRSLLSAAAEHLRQRDALLAEKDAQIERLENCDCFPDEMSSRACDKCGRRGIQTAASMANIIAQHDALAAQVRTLTEENERIQARIDHLLRTDPADWEPEVIRWLSVQQPPAHNHHTRVIKRPGSDCPACEAYHERHAQQPPAACQHTETRLVEGNDRKWYDVCNLCNKVVQKPPAEEQT